MSIAMLRKLRKSVPIQEGKDNVIRKQKPKGVEHQRGKIGGQRLTAGLANVFRNGERISVRDNGKGGFYCRCEGFVIQVGVFRYIEEAKAMEELANGQSRDGLVHLRPVLTARQSVRRPHDQRALSTSSASHYVPGASNSTSVARHAPEPILQQHGGMTPGYL